MMKKAVLLLILLLGPIPFLAAAPQTEKTAGPALHRIESADMIVEFDRETGAIHSLAAKGDPLKTNFVGNRLNTGTRPPIDPHWTGDVVTRAWILNTPDWVREQSPDPGVVHPRSGRWRKETTTASSDVRTVSGNGRGFRVSYARPSGNEDGIRSFTLNMAYSFDADGALVWDITIANATDRTLELGELALPLRANDDYAEAYGGLTTKQATVQGKMAGIQKIIHEQKVLAHTFIGGHSSYALLQRPNGSGPFLLLRCEEDTSFECSYKADGPFGGNWIGADMLAVHSWGKNRQDWSWSPWINGHTSLVLEPGETKSYRLKFAFISDYPQIREELARSGNLGIRVLPSMVIPEHTDALVEVRNTAGLGEIEIRSDGVTLKDRRRIDGADLLTLSFAGRGQKSLKLRHGDGRSTWLHFYCIEDAASLLKARARFMAARQYYENPDDPYNRHHVFLPFDYRLGRRLDDTVDVWEAGGTGDPGFGDPLFLAEKNVCYPDRGEIDKLEAYIDDCLFRHIQNPETYEVRDSLFWKVRTPSSYSSSFSKMRAEATWRTYNYTFVANIYHALYRIGKRYEGLLKKRTPDEYLRMCYRTCEMWFTTGPFKHVGLITGSNAVDILADLAAEGWTAEHDRIQALMRECNAEFLRDPYPYSSEIEIDETGQHQVYFFARYFGSLGDEASRKKRADVVGVLKALRGGDQPVWFNYGNDLFAHPDLRGQIACWHSESINGLALLTHFDDSRDSAALMKGYPGVWSVLHNVYPDGMGFAWFNYNPEIFGYYPSRTFEGGLGLWGFLRAAKSYVVEDPVFGLVGYGCRIGENEGVIRVVPEDGVRKRLRYVASGIDVEATAGEIAAAVLADADELRLEMADTTGLVKTVRLAVRGLSRGAYEIVLPGATLRRGVFDVLKLDLPLDQAHHILIRKTD